jgi:hypothetical protein
LSSAEMRAKKRSSRVGRDGARVGMDVMYVHWAYKASPEMETR